MHDQDRDGRCGLQHVVSEPTKNPFAQPRVTITAHHQQGLALGSGVDQRIRGIVLIGLESLGRDLDAAPTQIGRQLTAFLAR